MTNTALDLRPGTYSIDTGRSTAAFTATHVFGLKPVHGRLPVRSGTVTIADDPRRSTVSAELDAIGWQTDDPKRDKDVRGKRFLDVERHPVIAFRSTGIVRGDDGWRVAGVLSVRGGSTAVELHVTQVTPTADGYRFVATTQVDRVAAGVAAGRALIARPVAITLTITVA